MILKLSASIVLTAITLVSLAQTKTVKEAFIESYKLESLKKYDAAIDVLNKSYDATGYELNLRLGWLNTVAGKQKESVMYYQKAMAIKPNAVEAKWSIIGPLTVLENWKELEKNYISILTLEQNNSMANYNLGLINYYRKDYVTAKKHFDVSLSLYPFDYTIMLMSAWNNYFLGNKAVAKDLFNNVLLYRPTDASAMEGLALIK
jgi:tetratricopeptide (TPR) repeat protein